MDDNIYIYCNGYSQWKWTRWTKFKTKARLFPFLLLLFGKVWIKLLSLQLWINNRAEWALTYWNFQQDNDAIHNASITKKYLLEQRIRLLDHSACSPNHIEKRKPVKSRLTMFHILFVLTLFHILFVFGVVYMYIYINYLGSTVLYSFSLSYLPNPSARAGYDTRSIF